MHCKLISPPSYSIDLEYLWQTQRWLSVRCEASRAKMVQPLNEEHLCLINLPIFVCDEEAGIKRPAYTWISWSQKSLLLFFFFFFFLHTAEFLPKGWAVLEL